jgi:prophage maintenance system killer protein
MNLRSIDADALLIACLDNVDNVTTEPAYDSSRLQAALLYPAAIAASGKADVAAMTVAYARGIIEHRPFRGDNTHAALVAMELFLSLNGWAVTAPHDAWEHIVERFAQSLCTHEDLANWLRVNL